MSSRVQRRLQTLTCCFWIVTAISCGTLLFHRSTTVRVLRAGVQLWYGPKEAPLVPLADVQDGLEPSEPPAGAKRRGRQPMVRRRPAARPAATTPEPEPRVEEPEEEPETTAAPPEFVAKYGFYIHAYSQPAAVIYQVRQIKKFFPGSPIYVMSDGGLRFDGLCEAEGCIFQLCPPANDRWHPWPFLRRMYDAAVALRSEYVILLEPDNTLHGPITRPPTHDAGGLRVPGRRQHHREYPEKLAQKFKPGFKWRDESMEAGLCGGSYYRTAAILDAFSDEAVAELDWNYLGETCTKEVFSSDFAMQYVLAARGYEMQPWDDATQMHTPDKLAHGKPDAAFKHYGSVKPTYAMKLEPGDAKLFKDELKLHKSHNTNCQVCYNLESYVKKFGSDKCTNHLPFEYSELLKQRYPGR